MSDYEWRKTFRTKLKADVVGVELERIRAARGNLSSDTIVEESTPKDAAMHNGFTWDNKLAAHQYRKVEAEKYRRNLMHVVSRPGDDQEESTERVYEYVNTTEDGSQKHDWKPIGEILMVPEERDQLLERARQEMRNFQRRYKDLKVLADVFSAMDAVLTE